MSANSGRHRQRADLRPAKRWFIPMTFAILATLGAVLTGCKKGPTPTPPPPTKYPTATPSPYDSLEESRFTITLDDQLIAIEELHVGEADGELVVFAETRYVSSYPVVERRTVVLSRAFSPVHYELEYSVLGEHSTWVAAREGDAVTCFANNLDWYGPVLTVDVAPAPQVLLERAPSALPFALLALRFDELMATASEPLGIHWLDVTEDLPVSRPLSLTVAPARQGAVIGTVAFEGRDADGGATRFTMWLRPRTRALYGAEIADFEPGFWQRRMHPTWPDRGRLVIQRVSQVPKVRQQPIEDGTRREAFSFQGADGHQLAGTLLLPEGTGPFPCLVFHSSEGLVPRWDPGGDLPSRGVAVYCYDKRGLGESEGSFDRDRIVQLAADAIALAPALAKHPLVDGSRMVFVGFGEGGRVGALVASRTDAYTAAVLAAWGSAGAAIPGLAEARAVGPLADHYAWTPEQVQAYLGNSLEYWQQWLFEGKDQVSFLGRRVQIESLREQADMNVVQTLAAVQVPVLMLHSRNDAWLPISGVESLQAALAQRDVGRIEFQYLDSELLTVDGHLSEACLKALAAWLEPQLN